MEEDTDKEPFHIFDSSDKQLIIFAQKTINQNVSDIIAPEMTRRLKNSTDSLNSSIKEFDKANRKSSNIMIVFTAILIVLTILLSWQTFMQFVLK